MIKFIKLKQALNIILILFGVFVLSQYFELNIQPIKVASAQQCNFDMAACSWSATTGAVSYSIKVTEIDTGNVIKNERVGGTVTRYAFPVTQNRTYRCEVAAINSCGESGQTGEASALCAVEGLVASPSPSPSVAPTSTPAPQQKDCAFSCTTNADCKSGLICVTTSNGLSYCSMPQYQDACKQSPSANTCCQAPPQQVTQGAPDIPKALPQAGILEDTLMMVVGGAALVIIGALLLI